MKKQNLLIGLALSGVTLLTAVSFSLMSSTGEMKKFHVDGPDEIYSSSNPPLARTGAPGEGNCTGCHVGSTMSAGGVVTFDYSGPSNTYYADSTYEITLSLTTGTKNGFEMTILDDVDEKAGTFTAGANTSVSSLSGREYIRHSSSVGITSWTFNWTAPSTAVSDLRVYFCVNRSNEGGSAAGDEIFLGQDLLVPAADASISVFDKLDKAYTASYIKDEHSIAVNYQLFDQSHVVFNVQDLSGRLIEQFDMDYVNPGQHSEKLQLENVDKVGMYLVSIFIGNEVFNRKVFIH